MTALTIQQARAAYALASAHALDAACVAAIEARNAQESRPVAPGVVVLVVRVAPDGTVSHRAHRPYGARHVDAIDACLGALGVHGEGIASGADDIAASLPVREEIPPEPTPLVQRWCGVGAG